MGYTDNAPPVSLEGTMIKVKNWDRYTMLMHDALGGVLSIIKTTDNERIRNYMTAISHYLCKDVYHVASIHVKSAFEKCRKIAEYDNLILLAYISYCDLIECLEFTED